MTETGTEGRPYVIFRVLRGREGSPITNAGTAGSATVLTTRRLYLRLDGGWDEDAGRAARWGREAYDAADKRAHALAKEHEEAVYVAELRGSLEGESQSVQEARQSRRAVAAAPRRYE